MGGLFGLASAALPIAGMLPPGVRLDGDRILWIFAPSPPIVTQPIFWNMSPVCSCTPKRGAPFFTSISRSAELTAGQEIRTTRRSRRSSEKQDTRAKGEPVEIRSGRRPAGRRALAATVAAATTVPDRCGCRSAGCHRARSRTSAGAGFDSVRLYDPRRRQAATDRLIRRTRARPSLMARSLRGGENSPPISERMPAMTGRSFFWSLTMRISVFTTPKESCPSAAGSSSNLEAKIAEAEDSATATRQVAFRNTAEP